MHIDHDHVSGGEHSHPHTHEHLHADCTSHDHTHTPMEELLALMKYMVGHNAAHAKELADLAAQLKGAAGEEAYQKVMSAVADFDKGNEKISEALKELGEE